MEVFYWRSNNSCLLSGGEIDLDVCDTPAKINGHLSYSRFVISLEIHSGVNLGHSVF